MRYYSEFPRAIPLFRVDSHVLLTRPPLVITNITPKGSVSMLPFDLHVLGLPPAFNLSHDQTLHVLGILGTLNQLGIIAKVQAGHFTTLRRKATHRLADYFFPLNHLRRGPTIRGNRFLTN